MSSKTCSPTGMNSSSSNNSASSSPNFRKRKGVENDISVKLEPSELENASKTSSTENISPNPTISAENISLNLLAAAISANAALSENNNKKSSKNNETVSPVKRRRLVANARERSRVHTISAAFEAVRQQIPAYTCNQKMSKLSILRIATAYIHALTVMVDQLDERDDKLVQNKMNECTKVIQMESKTKSRKNK